MLKQATHDSLSALFLILRGGPTYRVRLAPILAKLDQDQLIELREASIALANACEHEWFERQRQLRMARTRATKGGRQ
ncbi:MAG TPA: hypothetical protein VIC84_04860 [Blastocatellia bacterium]|jgi:hypothetical protein